MANDDVVSLIEVFGRYQRRIYLLLCLPIVSAAFHFMSGVFLAAKTDFRCLLPHESRGNATFQLPKNFTSVNYPWNDKTKSWPKCERYDTNLIAEQYRNSSGNYSLITSTVKCNSFVYDKTIYKLSITTEFDLVCDDEWLSAASESVFMVGVMVGAIIFGSLSDRHGRKPIYCLAIVIYLVSGIIVAVTPEIISYMIFRMIVAGSVTGIFSIAYVIVVEMVSPKKRLTVVIGIYLSFTLGYVLTAGFAYFITNWRILQTAITLPSFAFLAYWWFVPESVRWLLTKGRIEEAKDLLQKASSINGLEISRDTLDNMLSNSIEIKPETEKTSILDLLKYPNLRRKSLILFFAWFVNSGTYYGLSWNTSNLGGNDYINFLISAAVEVPAHIFVLFTLNRWGRKIILCGCMLFAGTSLLLTTLVPTDMPALVVVLAMLGKSSITGSFGSVYIFTTEQYPTTIRNIGLGACSTFARIAGLIVPYVNHTSVIWKPLPLVMFGSAALLAGSSIIFLPETLNEKLPETIQDGEQFGKKDVKLKVISRNRPVLE